MNLTTRQRLQQQTTEAVRHLRADRCHLAIRMLWRVLRARPDHVTARLRLAEALLRTGEAEQALGHLDAAELHLRLNPDGAAPATPAARHRVLRGRALQQIGRPADAIAAWREAVGLRPDSCSALRCLAAALYQAERYDEALRVADRLLALRPNETATMRLMVDACEAAGQVDRAIELIDELARRRGVQRGAGPRYTRSDCLRLARLLRRAGRLADAVERYRALAGAIEGDPALAREWADLAGRIGDEAQAGAAIDAALRTAPADRAALTLAAEQKMRTGRFIAAGRTWWRLHQLEPTDPAPLAGLLVCAIQTMRHRLVERVERRFNARGSATRRLIALADAWTVAAPGEILADLVERRASADDAGVLNGLLSEAVATFEDVLPDHRDYADVHYHLAVCHEALGEPTGAADCLDRSLKINPGYIDAACRRAEQLLAEGHTGAADAVIAAALDRHPRDERLTELQRRIDRADRQAAPPIADAA